MECWPKVSLWPQPRSFNSWSSHSRCSTDTWWLFNFSPVVDKGKVKKKTPSYNHQTSTLTRSFLLCYFFVRSYTVQIMCTNLVHTFHSKLWLKLKIPTCWSSSNDHWEMVWFSIESLVEKPWRYIKNKRMYRLALKTFQCSLLQFKFITTGMWGCFRSAILILLKLKFEHIRVFLAGG